MDGICKDVNESWDEATANPSSNMQFRGSDDYIRTKFEEYVTAALSSVKYTEFLRKGSQSDVMISPGGKSLLSWDEGDGDAHCTQTATPTQ